MKLEYISHRHRKGLEHYSRNKCLSLFVLYVLCTLHFSRMRHHQGTRRVDAATAADRNQTRRDLLGGTEAPRTLRGRSVKDDYHCYHCRICERHALIPAVESCRRRMLDFTKNRYQISAGRYQVGVFSSGCTTSLRIFFDS